MNRVEYMRAYRRRKQKEFRAEFKPIGKCKNCGSVENLCWDHIDPATKKFDIAAGCSSLRSKGSIREEIKKCQILCLSCNTLRGNIKHSEELVKQIREADGTVTEIARRFGVNHSWVSRVRNGKKRVVPLVVDQ